MVLSNGPIRCKLVFEDKPIERTNRSDTIELFRGGDIKSKKMVEPTH